MTTNEMKGLVESYLLHRLDVKQTQEFERAMEADPALAREVERMRSVVGAFECRGEAPARRALKRIDSVETLRTIILRAERVRSLRRREARGPGCGDGVPDFGAWGNTDRAEMPRMAFYPVERDRSLFWRIVRIGVRCALVAVIAGSILFVGLTPEYSSQTLYDTYFTAQQHFETVPSRGGSEYSAALSFAEALYRREDYPSAVAFYAAALEGITGREIPEEARLYYSLALLQMGRTGEAIELLRPLAEDKEAELQDIACWNLALALLREGDRHESAVWLDRLSAGKGEFADKAVVLKSKIEKRRWF